MEEISKKDFMKLTDEEKWLVVEALQHHVYCLEWAIDWKETIIPDPLEGLEKRYLTEEEIEKLKEEMRKDRELDEKYIEEAMRAAEKEEKKNKGKETE